MKKLTIGGPESHSMDLVAENVEQLKIVFPEAFNEGSIDFDVLKQLLGDVISEREEKFGLNWHGKRQARQLALIPSIGTLRPCPKDSVDWDTTQNLMIEGDNLEVLKLLQKSYSGKVKLIYIDPPYNTGKDFIYPDNFRDGIKSYLQLTGQLAGNGQKLSSNTEASGRFHTDWLNMMYPRLKLARNLLREDGVLMISIDDNEVANTHLVLNEIFGEENTIATFIWKRKAGGGDDSGYVATEHEYVLCYARNKEHAALFSIEHESPAMTAKYNRIENGRRYYLERLDKASLTYSSALDYEIECPDGTWISPPHPNPDNPSTTWRWGKATVAERHDELIFQRDKKTDEWRIYTKTWESLDGVTPRSLLVEKEHGRNRDGTQDAAALLGAKVFNNPKPLKLLGHLINIAAAEKDAIVLDFFAGSGTTGHALMNRNLVDDGNRRFILVQLPEDTRRSDYSTIAELARERLRRAGIKAKETNPLYGGDVGFRTFKLDASNIRTWNPDPNNLEQMLIEHTDHLLPGRTEQDLLYEVLLKRGLDLCVPMETRTIAGKTVHTVGGGVLFTCLDEQISRAAAESLAIGIAEWHKELDPAGDSAVVFRDSAFADDVAKTNAAAILQQYGIVNVQSL